MTGRDVAMSLQERNEIWGRKVVEDTDLIT